MTPKVELAEVVRYMHMGRAALDRELAGRVASLVDDMRRVSRPVRVWRRLPLEDGAIAAGPASIPVRGRFAAHLDGCGAVYLVCGSLGHGVDALQRRVSAVSGADALIVQAIGAAMMESWMDAVEDEIRAELPGGESLAARYSPGYGDFPLEAQREILSLLDAPRTVGVSLTDSLLMVPSKSVSAVIGVKPGREAR